MSLLERDRQESGRATDRRAPPTLRTARLLLRAPRPEDAAALTALINDRRIAENTARIPHPYTLADADGFIAKTAPKPGELNYLLTLRDGTLIGGCGITRLLGDVPELGYWLGVRYWGQGYATEAARALVDYAFADLGYDKLEAGARVSNPASRRVLEKCGFKWTGVMLMRVRALRVSVPVDRFELQRARWASFQRRAYQTIGIERPLGP